MVGHHGFCELDFFDLDKLPEFSSKLSQEEFDIALKAYNSGDVHFE